MAFVDVALTVGAAVGLEGTAAVIGGGALIGAGAGAVGGGLYGALSGKSVLNNALGGAGIGALVGAGAGYAMAPAAAAVDSATLASTAVPSALGESAPVTSSTGLLGGAAPSTVAQDLSGSAIAPGQMNPISSGMMNASTNSTSSLLSNLTPTGTSDMAPGTLLNNGTEMVGPNGSTYLKADLQNVANQMGASSAGQMGPTNAELGYTGPGTPSTNAAIQAADAASKAGQPWYQVFKDHPIMTGLGALTLMQMAQEQKRYGVPSTTAINNAPPKNLNYAYNNATPMNLNRSYADGGSVNLDTSPIKQQLNGIATGDNQMFPQPGLHSNQYANAASTPVPGDVLSAPTDTLVDPYTGQQKMAGGGITKVKKYGGGGLLEDLITLPINQIQAIANNPEQAALGINTPFETNVWNSVLGSHYQPLTNMYGVPTNAAMSGQQAQQYAAGGATQANTYAAGGNLGGYSDGGRMLKGPGDGMSDDIPASIGHKQPARLADSEFVIPADVVSHLGNGSSDAGAKKLYQMMDKVRMARTGTKKQGKQIKADKYMPKFADGGAVPAINAQLPSQQVTPAASPALVLPSQAAADQAAVQAQQAPTSMADQYAAYRNNMLNQYAPTDANFLKQQYLSALGRAPDPGGMDYWTKQLQSGASPQDVANQFTNSQEAQHVNSIRQAMGQSGGAGQTAMNQSQALNFLTSAYNGVLGRAPDAGGMQYWTQQLTSGAMTPQQVQQALMNSSEYTNKNKTASTPSVDTSVPAATGGLGSTIRKRKK
jgi:hypothetical protein